MIEVFKRVKDIFLNCDDIEWCKQHARNKNMLADLSKVTVIVISYLPLIMHDKYTFYQWYNKYFSQTRPLYMQECADCLEKLNIYDLEEFAFKAAIISHGIAHALNGLGFESEEYKHEVNNQATCIFNLIIENYVLKENINKDIKGDD